MCKNRFYASISILALVGLWGTAAYWRLSGGFLSFSQENSKPSPQTNPTARLRKVPLLKFSGNVDCNSPVHWDGDTMYAFNSSPTPVRSSGKSLSQMGPASEAHYNNEANGGRWIESTYKAEDGTLYGWYHNEPHPICSVNKDLTAPRIGATVSKDNGANWKDLGFVLEAPPDSLYCETQNHYFVGGNGDFSVLPDNEKQYFYFFISTYNKDVAEQGVAVARMRFADRDNPSGKVWKWHKSSWKEPGIGGHVSPIFPVTIDWNRKDADAMWGASIHWNHYLNLYVILLNRAIDKDWKQEGIYVTYNTVLSNPAGWSKPVRILDQKEIKSVPGMESGWYPQVVGIDTLKKETDKYAGRVARLFVHGKSIWEIVFARPGEH
jgi:hypothetical protein